MKRFGSAAFAVGICAITGGAPVAWATPEESSSVQSAADPDTPQQADAGPRARQPRRAAARNARIDRAAQASNPSTPGASPSAGDAARVTKSAPEVSAASRNKKPAPTAVVTPAVSQPAPVRPPSLTRVSDLLRRVADSVQTTVAAAAPAATPAVATAVLPALSALPSATPVMLAAVPAPGSSVAATVDLLTGNALSRLESPLAWTVLAASRNTPGRFGRLRSAAVAPPTSAPAVLPEYAPGEVLVAWKPGASASERGQAMGLVKASVMAKLGTQKMLQTDQGVVYRLNVPGGTEAAIRALSNNPAVAFVEPNYRLSVNATANDPYYTGGSLWGMNSDDSPTAYGPSGTTNAFGCGAEEAWGLGVTGSSKVVVAVLDEGVQITHPDLAPNIWTNPREVAGDGIDNDGNGYVDDTNGWDFYYDDKSVYDAGEDAHGTHVAGTIGAVGGNGTGVAGVCWDVKILPTKFLGPQGGYTSDAVDALNYITDLKTRGSADVVAVNNSWGGGGYSSALHGAILRAAKADILFVAAAGNATTNTDTTANWPSNYSTLQASATESAAGYEAVISVASITSSGALSSFSNYGATTVDLAAPGSGITSTVPTGTYANYNGTSMATPHVTGAIALYKSYSPTSTAANLRNVILTNAKPTTSLTGKTVTGGRLSLEGLFTGTTPTPIASYDPRVVSMSAPGTVKGGKTANVSVTVGNLGNTGVQTRVTLSSSGGTGGSTTVYVPAGGQVNTTLTWLSPATRGTYTLTATTTLVDTTLTDSNTTNNSKSTAVKVT